MIDDPPADPAVFVDTNVLVYAHDPADTTRRPIAMALVEKLWQNRRGVLSTQVLQEFYVVLTRKFDPPMRRPAARALLVAYAEWPVVQVDTPMIVAASILEQRHTLSFWDALIIEAARRAGATRVVSEDLQAGRVFGGIVIENPFQQP